MDEKRLQTLREKATALPAVPGVYLMKDREGRIIYVGKSRALCNRVSTYFSRQSQSVKTARMVSLVHDFDYILCETEMEALTLENVLIKKHTPKYNIKLKDAKSYPYLKITDEEYPRLLVTRDRKSDGGKYFGPYSGMAAAYSVRDTITRLFSLPVCKRQFPRDIGRERPCLYLQMERCAGLCTGQMDVQTYRAVIKGAEGVLRGNIAATAAKLEQDMRQAAEAERYEKAAYLRDSLLALKKLSQHQKVVSEEGLHADVMAFYQDNATGVLSCLSIREGKLQGKHEFLFGAAEMTDPDSLFAFILGYYADCADIPRQLLLRFEGEEGDTAPLSACLSKQAGHRVYVTFPQRGKNSRLCQMACENAKERARRYAEETVREDQTLIKLAQLLSLDTLPDRIEAYDISNLGDEHITASMAVCLRGKPQKSDYRLFRMEDQTGADDYAAMRQALSRRLAHLGDGSPSLGQTPDLILLDGGASHVRTVRSLLAELGVHIPVFGMVKDDFHRTRALTDGHNDIQIIKEQSVYVLIYRLQEEAHRFAIKNMMAAKRKSLRHSSLEKLPGIGTVKIKRLYAAFGSLKAMRAATEEELATVQGIRRADAHVLYRALHPEE